MDGTAGQENVFQLAFVDLAFQVVALFLNLIVLIFQNFTTTVLQSVLGSITGTTP